jgi:hypothetical protein
MKAGGESTPVFTLKRVDPYRPPSNAAGLTLSARAIVASALLSHALHPIETLVRRALAYVQRSAISCTAAACPADAGIRELRCGLAALARHDGSASFRADVRDVLAPTSAKRQAKNESSRGQQVRHLNPFRLHGTAVLVQLTSSKMRTSISSSDRPSYHASPAGGGRTTSPRLPDVAIQHVNGAGHAQPPHTHGGALRRSRRLPVRIEQHAAEVVRRRHAVSLASQRSGSS